MAYTLTAGRSVKPLVAFALFACDLAHAPPGAEAQANQAATPRRAILLLADGEDRSSLVRQEELMKLLRREGVQVFAVALVEQLSDEGGFMRRAPRGRAVALVTRVAEESGGRAFFPRNAAALQAAVEEIARNLRAQYVVEYRPTNTARVDKFRRVQVRAAGDRKVFARPGYFAGN